MSVAATQTLHTAQPSLSRQLRDLESRVGTPLMTRGARGIELTAAGRAFLDHARVALAQVDAAVDAARRAARPEKAAFGLGFLTGQEMAWPARRDGDPARRVAQARCHRLQPLLRPTSGWRCCRGRSTSHSCGSSPAPTTW